METLEQLKDTARKAGDAIYRMEVAERKKANAAKIGQVYKTRNSYSCPEKPSDYWWLYAKVTHMDADGLLWTKDFQTDCRGDINIRLSHMGYHMQGWTKITQAEFDRAWKRLRETITAAMK